jgi:nucleotide-binding universal stress UspA family protein
LRTLDSGVTPKKARPASRILDDMSEAAKKGRPIVVGTDGTAATRVDVREAARLAAIDGVDLHIVAAYNLADDSFHRTLRVGAPPDIVHELTGRGEAYLDVDEARQMISERHDLVIHTHVCHGGLRHAVSTVADAVCGGMLLPERKRRRIARRHRLLEQQPGPVVDSAQA